MSAPDPARFAAAVADLAAAFRSAVREDLPAITAAFRARDRDALRGFAHRHAGSAASFGFAALGTAAAAADRALSEPDAGRHEASILAVWISALHDVADA